MERTPRAIDNILDLLDLARSVCPFYFCNVELYAGRWSASSTICKTRLETNHWTVH